MFPVIFKPMLNLWYLEKLWPIGIIIKLKMIISAIDTTAVLILLKC